ncbi:MAG: replicative DNA helicase [Paludibacter sp.]|nr:replicative DNA helicase [Bacteroidales bacterium]MCM1068800.1 replicative DNA helicase [Prevotella sp.]MCM1353941.1 replicative DNA helicase [Bacteroides sp.]MCM1443339.1 replicative DNA helicase [Muribaculum sp.]MCM1482120.1 replicative DNA helicase [Paludibacter sp.]
MPTNSTPTRTSRSRQKQPIVVVGTNENGKLPPQAIELEESVLGALMLEKEAYGVVADLLTPDSFYKFAHNKIYTAMQHLAAKENPIDMLSVVQQLKMDGALEEAGGAVYISNLTSKVASTAHLKFHAQIVAQKALARDLIRMAANITEKAYDESEDVEDLMQQAEGNIFEISQRSMKRDVVQIDPVIYEAFERMKKAGSNDNNMSGVPSGFTDLDKVTSGWQKSDLIIIAARPAMGKTAFVLSMAKNMAVNYKAPVALFSLEMSNVQLVNRLIMNVCEIEGEKIRNGNLSAAEWNQLETRITELQGAPMYVDDTPSLSVFELRSKARKLVREHHVQCIIIDYLQLMNASGMSFGSREQEVSIISRNLKALAKELDIPIIALSQLNRGVEGRTGVEGKRPQLSDLRESGAIEQDADMVCFIHRPEYYFKPQSEDWNSSMIGKAEVIVAKHRNGATKTIDLHFDQSHARFMNFSDMISFNDHSADSGVSMEPSGGQQFSSYSSSINSDSSFPGGAPF